MKLIGSIILLSTSFIHVQSLKAQVGEYRSTFALGVNAGMAMNTVNFQPTIKQLQKLGPTMGISARYICEKYFTTICGVLAEINYANIGWREDIEEKYTNAKNNKYTRNLNYIQMPILMQLGWGYEERGMKFIIEAGPQFGFNIGSSEKYSGDPWDPSKRSNNVNYQYGMELDNKFDFGIAGGLGAELSTSIGHFIISGRYYYGLGDMFDNSKKAPFARSANQTITAKFTYLINISSKNNKNSNIAAK